MPVKVRELEAMLLKAGFICRPGKGSHRKYYHVGAAPVIMSGKPGDDAARYQARETERALRELETYQHGRRG